MPALDNNLLESHTNVSDIVRELDEFWDNRLDYPPTKVSERYLRGDLAVLVELSQHIGGHLLLRQKVSAHFSNEIQWSGEMADGMRDNEFPVLVGNVHLVDDPEGINVGRRAIVGLEFENDLECTSVRHALYLSVISGQFVFKRWRRIKNGKFQEGPVSRVPRGIVGQLPNEVIQARPEMMDNLAGKDAEAERNRQRLVIFESLRMFLVVYLGHDGVVAFLKEPGNLGLKIDDVLIGPY